jgi:lysophospholipase L1-like esterase
MRKRQGRLGMVLAVLLLLQAPVLAAPAPVPQFADGDTVCSIGDSITHGGSYHSYVRLFYATRFPERRLRVYNCGISGDTAAGALQRLEWDVLAHRPTVATIMLGMNDVNRWLYAPGQEGEDVVRQRAGAIGYHVQNMEAMAQRLRDAGCRLIFITPSIYDQTAAIEAENDFGVDEALAQCAEEVRQMAPEYDAAVVDLHPFMRRVNAALQERDPSATIVGGDRVHPGDVGHFVMAYAFLRAQGVPALVSRVEIDAAAGRVGEALNCTVDKLAVSGGTVSFECLEGALPFPVPAGARPALELVPFVEEMDREVLAVRNLPPGRYEVLIDDEVVQATDAAALAEGINLAVNARTPMYRQAEKVAALNATRHDTSRWQLRNIVMLRRGIIAAGIDQSDFEAEKAFVLKELEKSRDKPWYGYMQEVTQSYIENRPQEEALLRRRDEAMAAMPGAARPIVHRFTIRPVGR